MLVCKDLHLQAILSISESLMTPLVKMYINKCHESLPSKVNSDCGAVDGAAGDRSACCGVVAGRYVTLQVRASNKRRLGPSPDYHFLELGKCSNFLDRSRIDLLLSPDPCMLQTNVTRFWNP